ncbi:MAG TPA: hypothetical protein VFU78_04185, partial [Thermomicrobiales bacterium]|nr:hypothetical protein [Thermomicrobiales bacterium]
MVHTPIYQATEPRRARSLTRRRIVVCLAVLAALVAVGTALGRGLTPADATGTTSKLRDGEAGKIRAELIDTRNGTSQPAAQAASPTATQPAPTPATTVPVSAPPASP